MSAKYGPDGVQVKVPPEDGAAKPTDAKKGNQKQNIVLAVLVIIYFALPHALGGAEGTWTFLESMYFAVQTFTTVGYGDYTPKTDGGKIFVCFYIHLALVCIAVAVSNIMDNITRVAAEARKRAQKDAMKKGVQKKSAPKEEEESGLFHEPTKAEKRWAQRKRFLMFLFLHVGTLVGGGLIFAYAEDWEEAGVEGNTFVNGFYFAVVTMTTVGYGDITAQDPLSMAAAVFVMLFGVPIIGVTLQELTGMIFAAEKEELELELVGGLNHSHFESMLDFTTELATACGTPAKGKDGKISRFEFLCFTLVKNDVVEMENIEIAMKNFNDLDADGSGELEVGDLM
jgi:potassium channel subfamily K